MTHSVPQSSAQTRDMCEFLEHGGIKEEAFSFMKRNQYLPVISCIFRLGLIFTVHQPTLQVREREVNLYNIQLPLSLNL